MPRNKSSPFSRRERELVEILYRLDGATVTEVLAAMTHPPSYSAVRATLNLLEEKGHVRHEQRGRTYVYRPKVARSQARRRALRNLLDTFFEGSVNEAVATLLDLRDSDLSENELKALAKMINRARREGR